MEDKNIDDRMEKIETKLAFLEDYIQRLQEEVISRNSLLDKLGVEHKALKERVVQIAMDMEEIPNRKPPHY